MWLRPSYFRWLVVVVVALAPLAVMGVYALYTAEVSLRDLAIKHNRAKADIGGQTLKQQLNRSIELSQTVAGFPVVAHAAGTRDIERVRERLRLIVERSQDVDRAFVLDLDGTMWCDWPIAPESLGQNFAYRDYFIGVQRKWRPYVSEVFQRQAQPQPLVVAVSTPILDEQGQAVALLVVQHRLETVTSWLSEIDLGPGGAMVVLDHHGILAGHSEADLLQTLHEEYAKLEVVQRALRGETATIEYADPLAGMEMIATFRPVELSDGQFWVVIAEQSVDEMLAPGREYRDQFLLAMVVTAGLALGAAILLARASEKARAMGIELANRNRQLNQAIQAEREMTEALKKAQAQLVQQEKLAGLGQMVAGIAHEINNPLSFVGNNIAVLQRDLVAIRSLLARYRAAEPELEKHSPQLAREIREQYERQDLEYALPNIDDLLARSREGLRRIQQIVKDLRDFARLDENVVVEADVNAGVASTVNIIHGLAKKKRVEIEMELGQILPLTCAMSRINQVVMNLLSNAIDACREGGKVKVRTYEDGDEICIAVSDNGAGIDTRVIHRIFDPFFTTKPQGEGTGLGLSISHGIVLDHGGKIDVLSVPGEGSTFTVRLPKGRT